MSDVGTTFQIRCDDMGIPSTPVIVLYKSFFFDSMGRLRWRCLFTFMEAPTE